MQFEDFIQQMCESMDSVGAKRPRDPRALIYTSMAMMAFPETLQLSRKRDRIPMQVLAGIGRLLGMSGR